MQIGSIGWPEEYGLSISQCHNDVDDNDSGIRMNLLNFHDENPSGEEDGDDVMELDDE